MLRSTKNNKTLRLLKRHHSIPDAEDKFSQCRETDSFPTDLTGLGELARELLNDSNLEVSKVKPFFWSLVETYVDRFQHFPFDIKKVLFSYLEMKEFPRDYVESLIAQIESQYEAQHGKPLHKSTELLSRRDGLDEDMKALRDTLKYAAMVAELEDKSSQMP
jgi:AAA+ ATPase superfamily predicted ATPase